MENIINGLAIQDEMDKVSIEQLHQAVLQFSSNCFELKKMCITVLVSASALLTTFANGLQSTAVYIIGLLAVVFFWILDAQSYYYQTKLRLRMSELADVIAKRHSPEVDANDVGMPIKRSSTRNRKASNLGALFNSSMAFYYLLIILMLGLHITTLVP